MKKTQSIVKNALLAFVLISIGFVIGKHSVQRGAGPAEQAPNSPGPSAAAATLPVRVRTYCLHATARCTTFNTMERMTRDLLEQQFGDALAAGRIDWREVDFQENEAVAKQFDVISSCVLVAKMQGETVLDYKRLDEVWTLMDAPTKFNSYVGDAIRAYLVETPQGGAQ